MKLVSKYVAVSALLITSASVFAGFQQNDATYIKVKNNTNQAVTVYSSVSTNVAFKLDINGSTDTPFVSVGPHQSYTFTLTADDKLHGNMSGAFYLDVNRDVMTTAKGAFPVDIMNYVAAKQVHIIGTPSAESNTKFACSAVEVDQNHGTFYINIPNSNK